MNHASLFTGIGGFDLAAEWMGWNNVFQVEIDPFCTKVLEKNFPNAKRYGDIKQFDGKPYRGTIDVLSGGFPCQPYSIAGKRKGKEDDRHLWPEMLRAIREIQPTYIVGENVLGLVSWNGGMVFEEVQAEMEAEGYEVQPFILPACAKDAPHRRDRVWFVAHRCSDGRKRDKEHSERLEHNGGWQTFSKPNTYVSPGDATDTKSRRLEKWDAEQLGESEKNKDDRKFSSVPEWSNFPTQSPVRVRDDGISSQLDGITFPKWCHESIKAGGNAIVPQVAFEIFRAVGVLNAKTLHETSI